nr:sulfotransferase 2A8-like [Dermacentor andersoni]
MSTKRPYFQLVDGVPRPPIINPVLFKRSLNRKFKEGDVVLSTYPKSGTKWLVYIMQLILKEGKPVISFEDFMENACSVEFTNDEDRQTMLALQVHFTHHPLRRENMGEAAKFVYVARNPWDVCVSFYHMVKDISVYRFQDGSFADFLDGFLAGDFGFGSYFEHVASGYALKDEPHVFFTTYEELKRDTKGTVLRLAYFLGERYGRILEDVDNGMLDRLLERCTPEYMKDVMVVDFKKARDTGWYAQAARNQVVSATGYQGDKYKYTIVRNAKVGSWKDTFTSDQLCRLEAKIVEEGDRASFMSLWEDIRREALSLSEQP